MFEIKAIKEANPDGAGKIDNWHKAAQPLLSNPQKFLDSLFDFDKDNIPEKVINTIQVSKKGAELAQKLGQLQPLIAVFPRECMGQLAYFGPT